MSNSDKDLETIFREAIENAGYVTRSYSGRGMYGKKCLGFETSRNQSPILATAEIMADLSDRCTYKEGSQDLELSDFLEFFSDVKEDSMGLGGIVYFPELVWNESWDEDEDTSEDDNRNMLKDCGI